MSASAVVAAPLSLAEIQAAADIIAGSAHRTPVLRSAALDDHLGLHAFLKDESRQRTGSFKFRGAFHRLARIPDDARAAGVVAVSSGNHGAAVAEAARVLGMAATIHVPHDVAAPKRELIERAGATIVTFDRAVADREARPRAEAVATGATFVHPFEDRLVMAGQGTTALELIADVADIDVLLVPMSGGGLMAGCASAARALRPGCEIVGVEPAGADDTRRSFAAGHPVTLRRVATIADGLAVTRPGATTFAINRRLVNDVVAVDDTTIVESLRLVFDTTGRIVEPSGVVGIAAILDDPMRWRGRRVGIVVSGGNVGQARFEELVAASG